MSRLSQSTDPDIPCVWVQAGVLSYRPCHRNFECDGCELFHAIQGPGPRGEERGATERSDSSDRDLGTRHRVGTHGSEAESVVRAYLGHLTEGCDLHLDMPYSPGHFWLHEVSRDEILLGFDCQMLRILYPIDDFILPKPGTWIERGEAMGWIQRGHLALPLPAPISGEVQEVNQSLMIEIKENGFPLSRGRWLLRVQPHEPMDDIPELIRGQEMLGWVQRKLNLVREYLLDAAEPDPVTGRTMNDGGELNRNLESVLGSDAFRDLLDRLFREF
jgi:glycine cleavage system H lipoate-binding protein